MLHHVLPTWTRGFLADLTVPASPPSIDGDRVAQAVA